MLSVEEGQWKHWFMQVHDQYISTQNSTGLEFISIHACFLFCSQTLELTQS